MTSEDIPKEESKELEKERIRNEHKRTESFREGINWIVRCIILIIIVILLVVTWHHLTPESWRWLDDSDLANLHSVLFSGAVVGAITMHLNKKL